MKRLAPAKINLHLRVAPLAANGFHPLLSWMCTVGLFDTLTIDRSADDRSHFECSDPSLPTDVTNLVVRAARALLKDQWPIQIRLEKRIPAGGGLGGGSSDAAATLQLCSSIPGKELSLPELSSIAAALGSDVPFFLNAPSAICRGRGEIVRPISPPTPKWCLLILPGLHVSTPIVYRRFDEMQCGVEAAIFDASLEPDWADWVKLPAVRLLTRLKNDLEAPAFAIEPKLPQLRAAAERIAGRPVRMSGSGSSLFTLFDAEELEAADAVAQQLSRTLSVKVERVELAPTVG